MAKKRNEYDLSPLDSPEAAAGIAVEIETIPPHSDDFYDGRHAQPGDMVFFWEVATGDVLRPLPAMLIEHTRTTGNWCLNLHRLGATPQRRSDIPFSSEPKLRCWTWRE